MKQMGQVKALSVALHFEKDKPVVSVGRLALKDSRVYFEYAPSFLSGDLHISPLHLPLKPGVISFDYGLFEGLPGIFNDSLPDGWGRLLFDRVARSQGILPSEINPLDRLAYVGHHGLGALVYQPGRLKSCIDSLSLMY